MFIRRALAAAGATGLLLGVAAQPALAAGQPTVEHFPKATVSVDLGTDVCQGLDVRLDYTANEATLITFPDGTAITAGALRGSLTVIEPDGTDGPSVYFNFSGAGRIDPANGVAYAHGPWALQGFDDPTTPQWEGLAVLVNGNTVFRLDNSNVISTTTPVRDLCAELAAA